MLIAIDHGNKLVKTVNCPPFTSGLVEQQAQEFVSDLFSTLRGRRLELKSGKVVFVGGGTLKPP